MTDQQARDHYDDEYNAERARIDEDAGPKCSVCGWELEIDEDACWQCHGAGGWHDCGEDCCCCADPEEITDICPECDGTGKQWFCPNAKSHPKEPK